MDTDRRLMGIDLGIRTAHHAVITDNAGVVITRRRTSPTRDSLEQLETAALAGAEPGTQLVVVMEPTGAAWLPIAVFFVRRGHTVFRVSSARPPRYASSCHGMPKSNRIDAVVLARLPLVDPDGLVPLELPTAAHATLRRHARAADRLTEQITSRKQRIRDLGRHCYPLLGLVVTGELAKADIAVLVRWPHPRRLLRAGHAAIARLIAKTSRGNLDAHGRATGWVAVAREAVAVYGDDDPAVPFADWGAEIASEARILAVLQAERVGHVTAREAAYQEVDPDELARSLPGVAVIGGPVLVAGLGRPGRFPNGHAFKAFVGLAPKASETGDDRQQGPGDLQSRAVVAA